MWQETFSSEAHKCRELALRCSGPQQRLLINLAAAFEELARKRNQYEWKIALHHESPRQTGGRTMSFAAFAPQREHFDAT